MDALLLEVEELLLRDRFLTPSVVALIPVVALVLVVEGGMGDFMVGEGDLALTPPTEPPTLGEGDLTLAPPTVGGGDLIATAAAVAAVVVFVAGGEDKALSLRNILARLALLVVVLLLLLRGVVNGSGMAPAPPAPEDAGASGVMGTTASNPANGSSIPVLNPLICCC